MEYFLADLLPALVRRGVATAALVHDAGRHGHRDREQTASEPLPFPIYRAPCYGRLLYAPLSPQFPTLLRRAIGEFRPDALHLHLPNTSAFWVMALPGARKLPWVLQWQADVGPSNIDRRLSLAYRAYAPLERRLLARSSAIIASSPAYLASSQVLAPSVDKCRVIPLGIEPNRFPKPSREQIAVADSLWGGYRTRVLSVGRLTFYKGHDVLIRAMVHLPQAAALIVGEGEQRRSLQRLIASLGLDDRVRLLGWRPEAELHALFATCGVFCLPSVERSEAFGLVLLEAMRFAKPVVASDIPGSGVGWVVKDDETGMLVPPGDAEALATALRQVGEAAALRERLGQAGRERFQRVFHIQRVADEIALLYRELQDARAPTATD
jgi:rhamnosyl/mannosyltransferase